MVCATTTSVAHILHRSKGKNIQNRISSNDTLYDKPKHKSQRSMSQCPISHGINSKRIFQIRRTTRSNSTVSSLNVLPITRLLAVAKAQQENSVSKQNGILSNNKNFKKQMSLTTNNNSLIMGDAPSTLLVILNYLFYKC